MAKALLLSIIGATILLPVIMASDKNPKRGLGRALVGMFLFIVVWALACGYLYARLL